MKLEEILPDDIKAKLEKLKVKLLKRETSFEAFKEEMLKDPAIRKEYDRLEPKYKKIRRQLNKKKEDKNETVATRKLG